MLKRGWLIVMFFCLVACQGREGYDVKRYTTRYMLDGYEFAVKESNGERVGPQANIFSDEQTSVYQDDNDVIHLMLSEDESGVKAAEIISVEELGYGIYEFTLRGYLDQVPADIMISPFLYYNDENEVDIEFSTWERDDNQEDASWLREGNYQFIYQPYFVKGNSVRPTSPLVLDDSEGIPLTTYRIFNFKDSVAIEMYHGGRVSENLIQRWEYNDGVKAGNRLRFHLNIYRRDEESRLSLTDLERRAEVSLVHFKFTSESDLAGE